MPVVLLGIEVSLAPILLVVLAIEIGAIMDALTPYIQKIPWVGGAIANAVQGMAQAISGACGSLLHPIDHAIGTIIHSAARLVDWTYSEFQRHANLLFGIAATLPLLAYAIRGLRDLVHRLEHAGSVVGGAIRTLEREYHGIEHRVKVLERDIAKGIGHDVLPRIRSLERKVTKIGSETIPAIESAEGALANDISALGEYIRANFVSTATDAVTAAVAVGLAALGLGGLRCNNFRNLLGKFGCGLGSLLNDLLGLMIAGIALESVCEFLPLLEDAFGAIAGPMVHLLNEVPLGSCETQPDGWAHLSVSHGPLPPAQTLGPFPV